MSHLISPSFLSADFTNLEKEIKLMNNSEADWFHLDIMDGVFVPNITFGMPIISQIKKHAKKPLDVHLMIVQPERYIEDFKKAGADILTVHYEACTHLHRTVQQIKTLGMKPGVSLNPHTPVHVLENIIEEIDMVLLMSVNPGFGGQKFITNTYKKIRQLKDLCIKNRTKVQIEIDGGVDANNAKYLVESGADILVAGSYIFKSENPVETVSKLKKLEF